MYNSFDISKKILEFSKRDNCIVDPMKLMKLVYITHGWHLAFKNEPLISNEIQSGEYGPVIPKLYNVTKRFRVSAVDTELIELYSDNVVDEETSKFINSIWNVYGNMSGVELSARTGKEKDLFNNFDGVDMINEKIKNHYLYLISAAKEGLNIKSTDG